MKRSLCILLCGLLCLSPVLAAAPEVPDRFTFQEEYAAAYAREHPEEYAAFDAAEYYELLRWFLPRETWMANRGMDETAFKAAMWSMYLSVEADNAYADYVMESAFPAVIPYSGFGDVTAGSWYESAVKACYEVGLVNGTKRGFEPAQALTIGECTAIAARIREALTGEEILRATPLPGEDRPWYMDYVDYMRGADPKLTPITAHAPDECSRALFVRLLSAALQDWDIQCVHLPDINNMQFLPDTEDETVLGFYRAGILTGRDKYGTFDGDGTLTRAECAAMVARLVRPALRLRVALEPISPYAEAARLSPVAVMFETGVTAETFLNRVNARIFELESTSLAHGLEFHWDNILPGTVLTYLQYIKLQVLEEDLGVTEEQGTVAYKNFDYQWYYTRLIELTGKRLAPDYAVKPGGIS